MQAPMTDQNQESHSNLVSLPLYGVVGKDALQNNPVREQVMQLLAILSEEDTSVTCQQTASKTWRLFQQVAVLIFFLCTLFVALIFWLWGVGYQSGVYFRRWVDVKQPTTNDLLLGMLEIIMWPFKQALNWANSFVKKYLGLEIQFDFLTPELVSGKSKEDTISPPASGESSSVGQTSS
jgi:hypothetical protein